jgi:hypothetical protein
MSDEEWGSKQIELLYVYGAGLDEMQSKNAFGELGLSDEVFSNAYWWSSGFVAKGEQRLWR